MQDLLNYMLKGVLGDEKFTVTETEEAGRIIYSIKTKSDNVGLLIGKGGRMIKALRNLLKVRATLEKKAVAINIAE
jgi:predicted RNA-binding protein YlqC (UPF0109 family)